MKQITSNLCPDEWIIWKTENNQVIEVKDNFVIDDFDSNTQDFIICPLID